MGKNSNVYIERAIYYKPTRDEYHVIGYSKETKSNKILGIFKNILDAKNFRDSNIRLAKYGKGITKRITKKGESYDVRIIIASKTGKFYNIYIGTFNSVEDARQSRIDFIENLK